MSQFDIRQLLCNYNCLRFIGWICGWPSHLLSACLPRFALTDCQAYANLKGIVELQFLKPVRGKHPRCWCPFASRKRYSIGVMGVLYILLHIPCWLCHITCMYRYSNAAGSLLSRSAGSLGKKQRRNRHFIPWKYVLCTTWGNTTRQVQTFHIPEQCNLTAPDTL